MRAWATISLSIFLFACSPQTEEGTVAPVAVPPDKWFEDDARAYRDFQSALPSAPLYFSTIRSHLIDNLDAYKGSGRFRDYEKEFACPYRDDLINSINRTTWQIVDCDRRGVLFYRRHEEADLVSRRCYDGAVGRRYKKIEDEYETLFISLPNFRSFERRFSTMKELAVRDNFGIGLEPIGVQELEKYGSLRDFKDAKLLAGNRIRFRHYYVVDEKRNRLVKIVDNPDLDDCQRNWIGWVKFDGLTITLSSPHRKIEDMDSALSEIIALIPPNMLSGSFK